jgi:hypothetical protein
MLRRFIVAAIAALVIGLSAEAQFSFRTTGEGAHRILTLRPTPSSLGVPDLSDASHAKFWVPDTGHAGYSPGNIYISQNGGPWTLLSSFVGSGAVTSVFNRTGAVQAVLADYDSFYAATGQAETITGAWNLGSATTATTPATSDNDTSVCTTAFVKAQGYITSAGAPIQTVFGRTGAVTALQADYGSFFAETATANVFAAQNDFQVGAADTIVTRFGRDNSGAFQSLVELRTKQSMISSGNEIGRGAIRLLDTVNIPARTTELGYYQYGVGAFSNELFEFWTAGVSITHSPSGTAGFLAVRDILDTKDIRLRHDGTNGIIETTGTAAGGISISGTGSVYLGNSTFGTVAEARTDGSLRVYNSAGTSRVEISHDSAKAIIKGGGTAGSLSLGGGGTLTMSTTFGTVLSLANDGSAAFAGNTTGVTPAAADNDTSFATTAFVQSETLNSTEGDAAYVNATGTETIAGDKTFTNGVFESGRTVRMGGVTPVTHSGANFTAIGGSSPTWTVDLGDQTAFRYAVVGKLMTVMFTLRTTSVTGLPSALRIAIPGGFTTGTGETIGRYVYTEDGTTFPAGELVINPSSTFITLYKAGYSGTWATTTNTTRVEGTIVFEVQ